MNKKRLVVEFVAVFAVALVTTALVTFLWNLIGHGESAVDWEISFSLAITFGIILAWARSRAIKSSGNSGFKSQECSERRRIK